MNVTDEMRSMVLRLPEETHDKLKLVAQIRDTTIVDEIRHAIDKHLAMYERRVRGANEIKGTA